MRTYNNANVKIFVPSVSVFMAILSWSNITNINSVN